MLRRRLTRCALALAALGAVCFIYMDHSPRTYHFELTSGEGGSIPAGFADVLGGDYEPGTKIRLIARGLDGYDFDRWVSSGGGEFDDPEDSGAVFIMPDSDVTVTAQFERRA